MGRTVVMDQQAGFAGGLNSVADPAFLRPDQSPRMENFRLSAYGAALKRLGTELVQTSAITTFDTVGSVYGGIFWPQQNTIYLSGAGTASTDLHLYSTTYGTFPRSWTDLGLLPQYRPVIFTDNAQPQVIYFAGDNTQPVQKLSPAYDTLAVDSTSGEGSGGAALTSTWSHTIGSGSSRLLVVLLATRDATGSTVVLDPSGTPAPLTLYKRYQASGHVTALEIWYLANPASGTFDITATYSGSASSHESNSISFFGADPTTPFSVESPRTAVAATGQPLLQMPSHSFEVVIDIVATELKTNTMVPGAGQTGFASTGNVGSFSSYRVGANSTQMSWTGATAAWEQIAVSVQRAQLAPTITALAITSPPVAGLCLYNGRLWGWNSANSPNSLFYSNLATTLGSVGGDSLGNPAQQGGEIVVETFGLSTIVACAPVNGSLIIWHQRGISVLTGWGQDDIQVKPQALNAEVGMGSATPDGVCVANELSTGDIAYFITDLGLYKTNGGTVVPVGTPEKPDPIVPLFQQGLANPGQCVLHFNRTFNEVWISIANRGVYVYHVVLESWAGPFTTSYAQGVKQYFDVVDSSGNSRVWRIAYNGTAMNGLTVSQCDAKNLYTDDIPPGQFLGTRVIGELGLRRMLGTDPSQRVFAKSWRWINIVAKTVSQTFTVSSITEYSDIADTVVFSAADNSAASHSYYASPGGMGSYIDIFIQDLGTLGASQFSFATVQGNLLGQR